MIELRLHTTDGLWGWNCFHIIFYFKLMICLKMRNRRTSDRVLADELFRLVSSFSRHVTAPANLNCT